MKIHIKEPWWGAYQRFSWGDKIPGISFKADLIEGLIKTGEDLEVTIGKEAIKYTISAQQVKDLSKKYNSQYRAKFDTLLYTIPKSDLKVVE